MAWTDPRTLVVWCPDWPAVAAAAVTGLSMHLPIAVVAGNRVLSCSSPARADGVRRGMRRRDAQARCPELVVCEPDPDRDARLFEPVTAAVEELAPGVEVVRPGVIAVPAQGPLGYFAAPEATPEAVPEAAPEAAAERIIDHVATRAGAECLVGVADGLFAALLAARRGVIVPVGGTPDFLADLPVGELDQPDDPTGLVRHGQVDAENRSELIDLLRRLGIRTLGGFAQLSERDVASRFGGAAVLAHRLARGCADRPLSRRIPPTELVVEIAIDPPADRIDTAAFAARAAAQRCYANLVRHGLACTRLAIHAHTEAGDERYRVWRCAEPLTLAGVEDRVRWQLDGWLRAPEDDRPTAGIDLLRLIPEETVDGRALQFGFWFGGTDPIEAAARAGRALVRVQGLLGPDGVGTAVLGGGRGPADQVRLVPWGDERVPAADPEPPWPGRLPRPAPTVLPTSPLPARVTDAAGAEVEVTGWHLLTGAPHEVRVPGFAARQVHGWAGPWPVVERWWDDDSGRRAVRLQVVLTEPGRKRHTAMLLLREGGRWLVEGIYD